MKKIGFIGAGNMGFPILNAAVQLLGADQVMVSERMESARVRACALGVEAAESNVSMVSQCEYILVAVKPQVAPQVLSEIASAIHKDTVIVSIMAGVTIATIRECLGTSVPVVRLMPNTPAMVGEGMTTLCHTEELEGDQRLAFVKNLCESYGRCIVLPESLMGAAVCANGSSPAYVYLFIEALADSVVRYGIPRDTAYTLAAQTVLGAAKMVLETGKHPGELKDAVCSPGGTTIAAVAALEEYGFRNAIMKATDACYAKSNQMAEKK